MELRRDAFAAHGTKARSRTLALKHGEGRGRGRERALSPVRGQLRKGRPRSCKPNDQAVVARYGAGLAHAGRPV